MSTRTHIVLPDGLLERVDDARGDVPRSKWLTRAVVAMLEIVEPLEKASGEHDPPKVVRGASTVPSPPASPRASDRKGASLRDTWAR